MPIKSQFEFVYPVATRESDGFMSPEDKIKIDSINAKEIKSFREDIDKLKAIFLKNSSK